MNAEILAIGTELLLGEIADTNTAVIARALRSVGLDLYRTVIVGDNAQRIAQAVRESLGRSDVVITTGGLGPTVDDATRAGIALALGVSTEFRPDLWEQIQERFARYGRTPTENNRQQAMLPAGAQAIENPVGTAPGFLVESGSSVVISLPGVPSEMVHLLESQVLPYLRQRLGQQAIIKARVLRTAGIGESWLDERIADLELGTNPTVGLSAHPGQVDVRITVKAASEGEADALLAQMENRLRERLGAAVFGVNDERLEDVVVRHLTARQWRLAVLEYGLKGTLLESLASKSEAFAGGRELPARTDGEGLACMVETLCQEVNAQAGLGVVSWRDGDRQRVRIHLATPDGAQAFERSYGGPPEYGAAWATTIALDLLRRRLAVSSQLITSPEADHSVN